MAGSIELKRRLQCPTCGTHQGTVKILQDIRAEAEKVCEGDNTKKLGMLLDAYDLWYASFVTDMEKEQL